MLDLAEILFTVLDLRKTFKNIHIISVEFELNKNNAEEIFNSNDFLLYFTYIILKNILHNVVKYFYCTIYYNVFYNVV